MYERKLPTLVLWHQTCGKLITGDPACGCITAVRIVIPHECNPTSYFKLLLITTCSNILNDTSVKNGFIHAVSNFKSQILTPLMVHTQIHTWQLNWYVIYIFSELMERGNLKAPRSKWDFNGTLNCNQHFHLPDLLSHVPGLNPARNARGKWGFDQRNLAPSLEPLSQWLAPAQAT